METATIIVLNGLSYASTLFLVASGLTLIFGVTRIVNFAHGSFFMLGALFSAHWLVDWFPGWADSAGLYAMAIALGALCAAAAAALAELGLLRRLYGAPQLYQLVATFGLSLFMHDAMRRIFGPGEVFAPRFPGLRGAIAIGEGYFPTYQLVTIVLGPLVWLGLHLLLQHTRFGTRVRAATGDREMLAALGVNTGPVMLAVVLIGCALAGAGGALQLPREPASLQMDTNIVVETFAVVVTGGLGSIGGAFMASLIMGQVHAVGANLFPQATLVLVFLTMGALLVVCPTGLLGAARAEERIEAPIVFAIAPARWRSFTAIAAGVLIAAGIAIFEGPYWQSLVDDALILLLFGVSLQVMMAFGGLVSFGHSACFGLGAYGAALVHLHWGWSLPAALLAGGVASVAVAALAGAVLVRSSGVYLAMLSLALAQVVWASANQWVDLTGGDNGLIGLGLVGEDWRGAFSVGLAILALGSIAALRRFSTSSFGAALQAGRDAPLRAAASGMAIQRNRWMVFVISAALAGLAGALFAANKGSVFPSVASVATSLDVLLVVLLGGLHHVWGSLVGAGVMVWASALLGRNFDYWRGALGLLVMLIMAGAPSGILGYRQGGQRHGA